MRAGPVFVFCKGVRHRFARSRALGLRPAAVRSIVAVEYFLESPSPSLLRNATSPRGRGKKRSTANTSALQYGLGSPSGETATTADKGRNKNQKSATRTLAHSA